MDIILDTNFLLIPFTVKVEIYAQIQELFPNKTIAIFDKSLDELQKIERMSSGKEKEQAKLAQMLAKQKAKIIHTDDSYVDRAIIDYCKENPVIVATQDKELKKQLKNMGIKTLILRNKAFVQEE